MAAEILARFQKQFPRGPLVRVEDLRLGGQAAPVTVLFGPSGSGKTTILRCLAGLEQPEAGEIQFGSETWYDARRSVCWSPQQRKIGFLSQDRALFPHLNVEQNIAYGLRGSPAGERAAAIPEMIRLFDLKGLEQRLPRQLSGGEQQRVALARVVARHPRLLLLDEPLSALDSPTRQRLRSQLRHWLTEVGIPSLVVTHDRLEALSLGDRLIVLHQGQIVQTGTVQEVFSRPANLEVAGIVAIETIQPGQITKTAEGVVTVAVGSTTLCALEPTPRPEAAEVHVCIRAEDVALFKNAESPGSPRNRLPATVRSVTREGPLMRVDLDCGFLLAALLTRPACEELALQPGVRVVAVVKAPHVHLIPR